MNNSIQKIHQRIDAILLFLQPNWEFVNCHMVNYLTHMHWTKFVPAELRSEINNEADVKKCIENVFWRSETEKFPAFANFFSKTRELHLLNFDEILSTTNDLFQQQQQHQQEEKLNIKEFMNAKKCHEVEITASLVNLLIKDRERQGAEEQIIIVDAGDGKGYLSSRLCLEYNRNVLGIDANANNTLSALERSKRLQRAWNALVKRAKLQRQNIIPSYGDKQQESKITQSRNHNYKTIARFITADLNLKQLVSELFEISTTPTHATALCLTGLHTCGNLAATCLRIFQAQDDCKILCNVGCCYHLLKESYTGPELFSNKEIMTQQSDTGFPLSQYLNKRQICLGRNARMLAAQSIERTINAKELPNISIFYRALLEVLICEQKVSLNDTIKVGKVRKFNNFQEYVGLCANKLNLNWPDKDELDVLEKRFLRDKHYLQLFYLLRMCFAPILESLILLDRLLYLKEMGYERSHLISLFDAVISPRHFAVIALKD